VSTISESVSSIASPSNLFFNLSGSVLTGLQQENPFSLRVPCNPLQQLQNALPFLHTSFLWHPSSFSIPLPCVLDHYIWSTSQAAFVPDSCQHPSHSGLVAAVQYSDAVHVVAASGSWRTVTDIPVATTMLICYDKGLILCHNGKPYSICLFCSVVPPL